jgi:hypothetical protein
MSDEFAAETTIEEFCAYRKRAIQRGFAGLSKIKSIMRHHTRRFVAPASNTISRFFLFVPLTDDGDLGPCPEGTALGNDKWLISLS